MGCTLRVVPIVRSCVADTLTGQGDKPFVSLLCTVLHGLGGLNRGFCLPLRPSPLSLLRKDSSALSLTAKGRNLIFP